MLDSGNLLLLELWRKHVLGNTNPRIWGSSFLPPPRCPLRREYSSCSYFGLFLTGPGSGGASGRVTRVLIRGVLIRGGGCTHVYTPTKKDTIMLKRQPAISN